MFWIAAAFFVGYILPRPQWAENLYNKIYNRYQAWRRN